MTTATATTEIAVSTAATRCAVIEGAAKVGGPAAPLQGSPSRPLHRIPADTVIARRPAGRLCTPETIDRKRIVGSREIGLQSATTAAATVVGAAATTAGDGQRDTPPTDLAAATTATAATKTNATFDPITTAAMATIGPAAGAARMTLGACATATHHNIDHLTGAHGQAQLRESAPATSIVGDIGSAPAGCAPHFYPNSIYPGRHCPLLQPASVLKNITGNRHWCAADYQHRIRPAATVISDRHRVGTGFADRNALGRCPGGPAVGSARIQGIQHQRNPRIAQVERIGPQRHKSRLFIVEKPGTEIGQAKERTIGNIAKNVQLQAGLRRIGTIDAMQALGARRKI